MHNHVTVSGWNKLNLHCTIHWGAERSLTIICQHGKLNTVKFRKKTPRLIFFKGPFWGAYFWRGFSTEGNLRFKIDWASLIVGSKFIVFALFYFVFEGNLPSTSPRGAYIWRGDFALPVWGAYIWRGYTWRGLFSEFYGIQWIDLDNSNCFSFSFRVRLWGVLLYYINDIVVVYAFPTF